MNNLLLLEITDGLSKPELSNILTALKTIRGVESVSLTIAEDSKKEKTVTPAATKQKRKYQKKNFKNKSE